MHPLRELFHGLPRQGPGSAAATRRAVEATGLSRLESATVLDVGCGSGASTLVLAESYPFSVLAVDGDPVLLAELDTAARGLSLKGEVETRRESMFDLDFPDGSFDAVWSEGAVYIIGFGEGLRRWRPFVRPGGVVAVTELTWLTGSPPAEAAAFWRKAYPAMTDIAGNCATARALGYDVLEPQVLGPEAFWPDFYVPLEAGLAALRDHPDVDEEGRAMLAEVQREIDLYRAHGDAYSYVFYLCRVKA